MMGACGGLIKCSPVTSIKHGVVDVDIISILKKLFLTWIYINHQNRFWKFSLYSEDVLLIYSVSNIKSIMRLAKKVEQKLILKRSKEVSKRFHENFLSKGFQVKLLLNQNTSFPAAHSTVLNFKCRLLSTDFFVFSGLTYDRWKHRHYVPNRSRIMPKIGKLFFGKDTKWS